MIPAAMWLLAAALLLVVYTCVGYPVLLVVLPAARGRRRPPSEWVDWPTVSITIPVYNEEAMIGTTLDRILATDYPPERRQILVVSDASTDRTDAIVSGFAARGVELLRLPARGGKTMAENAAWPLLRGEIIVNTDASVRIHPAAVKHLIASFADPSVGVASGTDVSVGWPEDDANVAESRYVGYEMWVRRLETRLVSVVGASGCLYAIRAELHRHLLPSAVSRDFAAALTAWENGYRAVSVDAALCLVPRARSLGQEYHRKVRTMTRGLRTLWYKRRLLDPLRHRVFAWMLISHKLCRWLVPWALVAALGAVLLLSVREVWARWALAAGAVSAAAAVAGCVWPDGRTVPPVLRIPAYALVGTVAVLHAWVNVLRCELHSAWEPTRRQVVDLRFRHTTRHPV